MRAGKVVAIALAAALLIGSSSCALLSTPPEDRDQWAAMGGIGGGLTGAIIGSMAGSAMAGGLFGMPIGAVAGYFVGDRIAGNQRALSDRENELKQEIERLKRDNERYSRELSRGTASAAGTADQKTDVVKAESTTSSAPSTVAQNQVRESNLPSGTQQRPQAGGQQSAQTSSRDWQSQTVMISQNELRQVQRKLNGMGFSAGQVDGVWGPRTQGAVRNFQQSKNLTATGRLNEQTLDALDAR